MSVGVVGGGYWREQNTKVRLGVESGSYSTEASYQFKSLDRPANHMIIMDMLGNNMPIALPK